MVRCTSAGAMGSAVNVATRNVPVLSYRVTVYKVSGSISRTKERYPPRSSYLESVVASGMPMSVLSTTYVPPNKLLSHASANLRPAASTLPMPGMTVVTSRWSPAETLTVSLTSSPGSWLVAET